MAKAKLTRKWDTEYLAKRLTEEKDMTEITNEIGIELLRQTITNKTFDYAESLTALRVFCMLRMNRNNDLVSLDAMKAINFRYKLGSDRLDKDSQDRGFNDPREQEEGAWSFGYQEGT